MITHILLVKDGWTKNMAHHGLLLVGGISFTIMCDVFGRQTRSEIAVDSVV